MDGSFMTAVEQQHYSDLFSKSDVDNSGKVATSHVRNLFLSSQLPNETLQQIVELCGAARVGHFGRSQFYFALKLIAMAQNGLPLPPSIDKINTGVEVPLPAFSSNRRTEGKVADPNRQMEFINPAFIDNAQEPTEDYDYPPIKQEPPAEWKSKRGSIPPPTRNSRTGNAHYQVTNSPRVEPPQHVQNTSTSTPPSSPKQTPSSPSFQNSDPPTSPPHTGRVLERHKSLPSSPRDVPPSLKDKSRHSIDIQSAGITPRKIPTKDGGWASFEEVKEEKAEQNNHHQTPAKQPSGDEDTSWAKFPDQSGGDQPELKHSVSIPGSEGSVSDSEDVWQINNEQRTYYTNQFQRLQPEPFGLLGGHEAKAFFEKSKLPTAELSKIWQLSDVNKDGTLSLEEFCTAMHLVVLRKHSIPLPDKLPACLVPQVGAPAADEAPSVKQELDDKNAEQATTKTTAPKSVTPPVENNKAKTKDENWAKFHDSPLPRPPSPSSQSPANFDFASISPDPEAKIFQPIPLHVSPSGNKSIVVEQRGRTHSDPIRQDSSSDHEYDVPPPTLPEKKKRANTLDSRTPGKIAPPPPIEKSRRGDSLERNSEFSHHLRPSIPPRPGAQKTFPSQTSKSSSVQSSATSSRSSSVSRSSSSHSSSAGEDDDDDDDDDAGHTEDFADFSKFDSLVDSPTPESAQNRVASAQYTQVDSTPRLSPPPPARPRQQMLEDHSCSDKDRSAFLASKERHKSGDELQAERKRENFAHDRIRHASAPDPVSNTQYQDYDRKSIQAAIRRAKEENTKLSRLNSELQQELKQIMEDRIALETQLERLRPFSTTS